MDATRHKTLKRPVSAEAEPQPQEEAEQAASAKHGLLVPSVPTNDPFRNLLDESARDAFRRPWHRLERGLRLNRLRMYVEEMSAQCSFNVEEKGKFFVFLQNALDRKLLNTHKIVEYLPELQKIKSIRGLEVRRSPQGEAKWGFIRAKKVDGTRRVKKVTDKVEEAETSATQQPL